MTSSIQEDYVDRLQKLSLLSIDDLSDNIKLNTILRFAELKERNPTWNKAQICQTIGISTSTLTRLSNDLGIPSFYRYRIPVRKISSKKKNPPPKTSSSSGSGKRPRTKNIEGGGENESELMRPQIREYSSDKFQ